MEPTPRSERSSSRKLLRYAPFVGIVVAVVVIWLLFGRVRRRQLVRTRRPNGPTNGPVVFSADNKDSVEWGPSCDTERGHGRGPAHVRAAVRRAVLGRQRRRDRAGRHRRHDHDRALPGPARHPRADVLPAERLRRVAPDRARDGAAVRRVLRGALRDLRPPREDRAGEGERRARRRGAAARPDAIKVATEVKAFASWGGPSQTAGVRRRARRPAGCSASATACSPRPTSYVKDSKDHVWLTFPSIEQLGEHWSQFLTRELVGRPAEVRRRRRRCKEQRAGLRRRALRRELRRARPGRRSAS